MDVSVDTKIKTKNKVKFYYFKIYFLKKNRMGRDWDLNPGDRLTATIIKDVPTGL